MPDPEQRSINSEQGEAGDAQEDMPMDPEMRADAEIFTLEYGNHGR
jgi:hypothetical protein